MKLFWSFFSGIFILCAGCAPKTGRDVLTLDLDSLAREAPLFELEPTRYIPLETRQDALIGFIRKMTIRDSLIFISDLESNSIYLFDTRGNHRRTLSRQGRGPGEYIAVNDFATDEEMNLYVLCSNTLQILKYAYPNYAFERSITLDRPVTEIYWQDGVLWAANRMDHQKVDGLVCLDTEGNVLQTVIPSRGALDDPSVEFNIKQQSFYPGKTVLFNQRMSPDVYRLQNASAEKVFSMKTKHMVSEESRSNDNPVNGFQSVYETDHYIAWVLWENGRYENAFGVYEPATQKASFVKFQLPGYYDIMAVNGEDSFFSISDPITLMETPNPDTLLQKLLPELTEESNPILLEFRIRGR